MRLSSTVDNPRQWGAKGRRFALLLLVLLLVLTACGNDSDQAASPNETETGESGDDSDQGGEDGFDGDPVVIGIIEDQSGGASFYSQMTKRGMELAAKYANNGETLFLDGIVSDEPGIMGRKIELIYEDDEGDPNNTVVKTRALLDRGADLIYFMSGSSSALQGKVVCQEDEVFCIAPTNVSSGIISDPNADFVFTITNTFEDTGVAFTEAFDVEGYETLAYYSDDTATAAAIKEFYRQQFEEHGIETVADEVVPVGSNDATSQLLRIQDAQPDAIFDMTQTAPIGALLYEGTGELGIDLPRWGTNSVAAQPEMWELSGPSIDGLRIVDHLSPDNPNTQQWADAYAEEYGEDEPFTFNHGNAWDAIFLTKKAAEDAGSLDGNELVDAMEQISDFPSAWGQTGHELNYSAELHNGASFLGMTVLVFEGQEPSRVWDEYQPEE